MSQRLRGEGNQKVTNTGVGTNAGATATLSNVAGQRTIVTHISGSGDLTALITIESPAGTILWNKRLQAAGIFSESFAFGEYEAAAGQDILVKISASTSHAEANIAGVRAGL